MRLVVICATVLCCAIPFTSWAGCEQARQQLDEARRTSAHEDKIALLEKGIVECPDFALYYELGRAWGIKQDMERAAQAFDKAAQSAVSGEDRARAYYNLGVISQNQGKLNQAAVRYRDSLKAHHTPQVEKQLVSLEKERGAVIVPAAEITGSLTPVSAGTKGFGVVPSIDLRVQFEFNAFKLTAEGRRQADEIAQAIKSSIFKGMSFKIIGHTDTRGSDDYNDRLSLKRAEALKNYLVKNCGITAKRLIAEGMGKREPRFLDSGDDAQAMNRRVQIDVIS